jgi:hypothetical protein
VEQGVGFSRARVYTTTRHGKGGFDPVFRRSKLVFKKNRTGPAAVPQALVTTKLRTPRTRPNLVARPRLHEALARTGGRRLTLVSAPAGFGKTTLLGEWVEDWSAQGRSVAWVSLDGSDNDPARFLSYLVSALQTVEEGIGEGVLASLRSPETPPVEMVMGAIVNELADLPQEVSIVLDDYHLIASEPVHEAVAFLLEHLPENVHLVIASRTDPPLPLPKLRARDQMTEIRAAELRFTPDEAAAFLNDVMGLTLSARDLAALEEITEGWVAALQLAALSMRGRGPGLDTIPREAPGHPRARGRGAGRRGAAGRAPEREGTGGSRAHRRRRVQQGDRGQAIRLDKYRQDPHQQPLPQAGARSHTQAIVRARELGIL